MQLVRLCLTLFTLVGVQYFRNCDGAILVYDVTEKDSFNNIENWLAKLTESNQEDVPYIILENKTDLPEEKWKTSRQEVEDLKKKLNVPIISVSAKTGDHVQDAYSTLINIILEKNKDSEAKTRIKLNKARKKSSGGFC